MIYYKILTFYYKVLIIIDDIKLPKLPIGTIFPRHNGRFPYGSLTPYILSLCIITNEYDNGANCMRCFIRAGQSGPLTSPSGGFKQSACVINSESERVDKPTPRPNT